MSAVVTFCSIQMEFQLEVPLDAKISEIKELLSGYVDEEPNKISLVVNGKIIADDETFSKIGTDSPVNMLIGEDADEEDEDELSGLPEIEGIEIPQYNPPDLEEKIQSLQQLGAFSREICDKALRVSYFDINRAAKFLLKGNVPDSPGDAYGPPPEQGYSIQFDDEGHIILESLVPEDRESISKIISQKYEDHSLIIQTYYACNRDVDATLQCLS